MAAKPTVCNVFTSIRIQSDKVILFRDESGLCKKNWKFTRALKGTDFVE